MFENFGQNSLEVNKKKKKKKKKLYIYIYIYIYFFFFWIVASVLNKNRLGFVKFWKIITVFAQEKGVKNLTQENFELYELQWSSLLHLWSSKETTGDEKKNGVLRRNIFFLGFTVCKTGIIFFNEFIWFY